MIPILIELKRHQQHAPCEWLPTLTDDQVAALRWLKGTFGKIVSKAPRHANHDKAKAADAAISMFLDTVNKLHEAVHKKEERIGELEAELDVVKRRCTTLDLILKEERPPA